MFEASLTGRDRGRAVAVHDTRENRHRWVLATRGCVSGTIRWMGGQGDLAVGVASPTHPVYLEEIGMSLFAIDLRRGEACKVLFPARAVKSVRNMTFRATTSSGGVRLLLVARPRSSDPDFGSLSSSRGPLVGRQGAMLQELRSVRRALAALSSSVATPLPAG